MGSIKNKKFLSTGEVGKIFGVTRICVYNWIKKGKLPALKLPGGRYKVLREDIIKFLERDENKKYRHILESIGVEKKILIVDDDTNLLGMLKEFLERKNSNYTVFTANNGFDAGRIIVKIRPDVIILDLLMPGMDGFEVCKQIKQDSSLKDIKVIAITGYYNQENVERIKKVGADFIMEKPIDLEKLCELIER